MTLPDADRTYRALDFRFRLRCGLPDVASLASRLLDDLVSDGPTGTAATYDMVGIPGDRPFRISIDGRPIRSVKTGLALIDELLWHANREAILRQRSDVAIHAGAVSHRGDVVLMPAPAGSGKTTLTAAMLTRGWDYVSDEAVLVEPGSGRLRSYPKPMWMSPTSVRAVPGVPQRVPDEYRSLTRVRIYVRARDLGSAPEWQPARVVAIVLPEFRHGSATTIEDVSRAEGLVSLACNAFNLPTFGARGVRALESIARSARCFRVRFGEAGEAAGAIGRIMSLPVEREAPSAV